MEEEGKGEEKDGKKMQDEVSKREGIESDRGKNSETQEGSQREIC